MRRDREKHHIRPDLSRRIIGVGRSRSSPLRIQLAECVLLPGVDDYFLIICLKTLWFDSVSNNSITQITTNLCLQNVRKSSSMYAKVPVISSRFDGSVDLANWCSLRRLWPTASRPYSLLSYQQISTTRTLPARSPN